MSKFSPAPYTSSKSPVRKNRLSHIGAKERSDPPATNEKSDLGGRSLGKTSGILTGRRRAALSGIFDKEWIYGKIVC